MKNTKKLIRNFMLFLILIVITFYIILKEQNIGEIFEILKSVKIKYIIIAIISMCIYMSCEALNIRRTLKALKEKTTFARNLKYALIGFFFSSITPAASGGQPMQVYYMNKDNISVANSTLALLMNLTCMQIVTISLAIISAIFNFKYLNAALIGFFILGITLNASALALLIISIVSKRMTNGIINIVIKILKWLKIKNIEEKKEKELNKYQESAIYIKNNKTIILKNLMTTYIQYIIYYSISYWVYRSFGFTESSSLKIITLQSVLFATVSGIPSPGAVGVSEGGFKEIFKVIYPTNLINGAMLLCRGVNFYLFVILSSIIVAVNTIREKKVENEETLKKC